MGISPTAPWLGTIALYPLALLERTAQFCEFYSTCRCCSSPSQFHREVIALRSEHKIGVLCGVSDKTNRQRAFRVRDRMFLLNGGLDKPPSRLATSASNRTTEVKSGICTGVSLFLKLNFDSSFYFF